MTTEKKSRKEFMEAALNQARIALSEGEIPIGCVVVKDGAILSAAHNTVEKDGCALHHAEINAITAAVKITGEKYLTDCDIYVTVEPCAMCAGAIINSRIRHLYYGLSEPKTGCCGSNYMLTDDSRFNWRTRTEGGLKAEESEILMKKFFNERREKC